MRTALLAGGLIASSLAPALGVAQDRAPAPVFVVVGSADCPVVGPALLDLAAHFADLLSVKVQGSASALPSGDVEVTVRLLTYLTGPGPGEFEVIAVISGSRMYDVVDTGTLKGDKVADRARVLLEHLAPSLARVSTSTRGGK